MASVLLKMSQTLKILILHEVGPLGDASYAAMANLQVLERLDIEFTSDLEVCTKNKKQTNMPFYAKLSSSTSEQAIGHYYARADDVIAYKYQHANV